MITSRRQELRSALDFPPSIRRVSEEPVKSDPLDDLRQPLIQWFDSRITLDAHSVALRLLPRWVTSVTALYGDFCAWMFERQQVPPTAAQFRNLLLELCCEIQTVHGEEFIPHIILKVDLAAHQAFQNPPAPAPPPPAKRRKAARRRT